MHDTVDLEARGIPAVFVATEAFVDGAERQGRALGFEPAAVYVSHPVQDRTDQEMLEMAERAAGEIEARLVATVGS